jgi:hypothetical protein
MPRGIRELTRAVGLDGVNLLKTLVTPPPVNLTGRRFNVNNCSDRVVSPGVLSVGYGPARVTDINRSHQVAQSLKSQAHSRKVKSEKIAERKVWTLEDAEARDAEMLKADHAALSLNNVVDIYDQCADAKIQFYFSFSAGMLRNFSKNIGPGEFEIYGSSSPALRYLLEGSLQRLAPVSVCLPQYRPAIEGRRNGNTETRNGEGPNTIPHALKSTWCMTSWI